MKGVGGGGGGDTPGPIVDSELYVHVIDNMYFYLLYIHTLTPHPKSMQDFPRSYAQPLMCEMC